MVELVVVVDEVEVSGVPVELCSPIAVAIVTVVLGAVGAAVVVSGKSTD